MQASRIGDPGRLLDPQRRAGERRYCAAIVLRCSMSPETIGGAHPPDIGTLGPTLRIIRFGTGRDHRSPR